MTCGIKSGTVALQEKQCPAETKLLVNYSRTMLLLVVIL